MFNFFKVSSIFFCILIFGINKSLYAESLDFKEILNNRKDVKFIKLLYIARPNENLASIYKRFVKEDSVISKNEDMVAKTLEANKKIKDWSSIPAKTKILVYLDVDFIDLDKVTAYNKNVAELTKKLQDALKKKEKEIEETSGFKGSLFYMASYGKFTQANVNLAEIGFLQNSPLSLGLSTSYYPKKSDFSFTNSLYFSYLLAAASNLGANNVAVPMEIGGNLYSEYRFKKYHFSVYGGFDFEKFTTFNLEGVQQERKIYFDENKVLYLTVGASRKVLLFKKEFFTKLSFSHSISSSMDPGYPEAEIYTPFSGNKILFYMFKRYNDKIFFHSLVKYHWMSGPSDITTLRIGLGFGYLLF